MVGDNDAGAFGTYTQAGQNYGTTLLWTLLLLIPGALRQPGDGAAPGRGHRRRPRAPDPRALRQVLGRLQRHRPVPAQRPDHRHRIHRHQPGAGLSRPAEDLGVVVGGGAVSWRRPAPATSAASSASRWLWCFGSLLLVPIFLMVHPPLGQVAHDFVVPQTAGGRQAQRRDAADHRHRRHHGRAVAAVLPAELRHRQAHHAALHALRARSICGSASAW